MFYVVCKEFFQKIMRKSTLYFCSSFCHIIRSHKTKHQMHQKRLSKKVFDTFSAFIYKYFYKVRILFFCFISVPMAGFWSQLQSPANVHILQCICHSIKFCTSVDILVHFYHAGSNCNLVIVEPCVDKRCAEQKFLAQHNCIM